MWLILILVLIGVLLLVAELVLLPGISVARDRIVARIRAAIFYAFIQYGGIDRSGDADRSRIAFGTGSFYFAAGEYLATPVAESHDRFHVYPHPPAK